MHYNETKPCVLLKISGETMSGEAQFGLREEPILFIAEEIASVAPLCKLGVMLGGGNFVRGTTLQKELNLTHSVADLAGMASTIINGIVLQDILEKRFNLDTRAMSALVIEQVAEPHIRRRALRHLEKGRVVIFMGGTGNPRFSTDTALVLRAHEIGATMLLKGTKVDGIFDKDPKTCRDAKLLPHLSYREYLEKQLKIVDATAVTLAQDNNLCIRVFNIFTKGNLRRAIEGENIGSQIC